MSRLEALLRADEGCVLHAYTDTLGYTTIGVGRLLDQRKNGGITEEEASYLLNNDILNKQTALRVALPWFDALDDVRRAVLVSMAFNLGVAGALAFTTTLTHVRAGRWAEAATAMLQSKWAQQLPARVARLSEMMRTGTWPS